MDDLIDVVGIDARHSIEDKITPVEECCSRWEDRIAMIGGVGMDIPSRRSEEKVRARTRRSWKPALPVAATAWAAAVRWRATSSSRSTTR